MLKPVNINEITPQRIFSAIWRRVSNIPPSLAWKLSNSLTITNKKKILEYKNKYAPKRCFIIANGPSLKTMNLDCLKDEITFGMNRIYLLFGQTPFKPTFYVCIDRLVLRRIFQ